MLILTQVGNPFFLANLMCLCSSWAQDPFSMMLRVAKARAEVDGWWAASKMTSGRLFLHWYFEGHLALCKVFLWAGHLVSKRPVKSPRTSTPKPPVLPSSCSTKTLYLCLCALILFVSSSFSDTSGLHLCCIPLFSIWFFVCLRLWTQNCPWYVLAIVQLPGPISF